jgi:putative ATP-dependent endonuclease of OLD family
MCCRWPGVSLARALELSAALDRQVAGIRDNDGKDASHWEAKVSDHLQPGKRELFIGDPAKGKTLEPQLIDVNGDATIRALLPITDDEKTTLDWMTDNKTETALLLGESPTSITFPEYLMKAIEFIE